MGVKYYLGVDDQIYVTDHSDGLNVIGRLVDSENPPENLPDYVRRGLERIRREKQTINMVRNEEGVYMME